METILLNKENFKENKEIYKLLTLLENAHRNNDDFAASVLLTRLELKNIKIVLDTDKKQ